MKHIHTEGPGSILKSRFARGVLPFVAALFACALAAPEARAEVLVYEGFSSSDYPMAASTSALSTDHSLKDKYPTGHTTGFSSGDSWAGGTAVPKAIVGSLTPASAYDVTETNGTGRAIMYSSGTESKGRGIYRKFSETMPSSGTVYLRFIMKLNANVSDYTGVLQSGNYWAGGFVQNEFSGGQDAIKSLTSDGIWMGYKRTTVNSTAALSLVAKISGTDYTLPFNTVNSSPLLSTWSTYIFVARVRIGAGTGGKDLVDVGVQPVASTAFNADWDWSVSNVEANIVSGGTPISYIAFAGQYQTNNKEVNIDQFKIATTLAEVCNRNNYVEPSSSGVSVISTSEDNLTTSSVDLSATIGVKDISSATPSVAWGTAADALVNSATLDPISEAGSVTKSLTGLDPMTTYYYQWTVTASGADPATSQVASFKTKGEVVFGDVTAGGLPSEGGVWASVDVEETGIGATTVTCLCGETAENMTAIGTWQNVQAGDTLVATNSAAAWGKTYLFKFTSSFEYGNQTYESETPSASRQAAATDHLKTTASGNWLDGANWSLGTPPSDVLAATISNVTTMVSLYLQDADATVRWLSVKSGKATVDLRGNSSMTFNGISFGDANTAYNSGQFVTTGGVVTVNGNVGPTWKAPTSWNKLEINGTRMMINGELSTETSNDGGGNNSILVGKDAVLVITNGLVLTRAGTMIVDGGTVTNKANLYVATNGRNGTLTLRNGAFFRQNWANACGIGGKGESAMNVLSGSTFDAGGAAFYVGRDGDTPMGDSSLTVSNATFKVRTFVSPRYTNLSKTYTTSIIGADAVFCANDSVTLGPVAQNAGYYRASGATKMTVDGATVTVSNALNVGSGSLDCGMNYLTVSGPTVRMELGTLNCRTNATLKFVVPERGFENAAIISATNKVYLAAGMPPIKIDATACKGCKWTSLLEAEKGITNLTAENLESQVVFIESNGHKSYGDKPCELRLVVDSSGDTPVVKQLQFRVQIGGLSIIVR